MIKKDKSLSRYPEFLVWESRTGFFFPRLGALVWDVLSHTFGPLPEEMVKVH